MEIVLVTQQQKLRITCLPPQLNLTVMVVDTPQSAPHKAYVTEDW
jgi:hypothetical protein